MGTMYTDNIVQVVCMVSSPRPVLYMRVIYFVFAIATAVTNNSPGSPSSPRSVLKKFLAAQFWHACLYPDEELPSLGSNFSYDDRQQLRSLSRLTPSMFFAAAVAPTRDFYRELNRIHGRSDSNLGTQAQVSDELITEVDRLYHSLIRVLGDQQQ